MSRIVCNTGSLIALGLLERLDLLKALFSEVLIPEAVQREIEPGGVNQLGRWAVTGENSTCEEMTSGIACQT